jgi:hypothetical protein
VLIFETLQPNFPMPSSLLPHIRCSNMPPGVFGGFGLPSENSAFDSAFAEATNRGAHSWCCAAVRSPDAHSQVWYEVPAALSTMIWKPWQMPAMEKPTWCNELSEENLEYRAYANHPCSFLRNDSAFAEAAAII